MDKERLLARAMLELKSAQVVNLGIGLPTQLLEYVPEDLEILIHSENGVLGAWKQAREESIDSYLIDAGGAFITTRPGSAFTDSAVSFAMIRRGKIELSLLGAFEVDQQGNLANWTIPGRFSPGIGGAMELAQKSNRVVALCGHTDKNGKAKILEQCRLPLTAKACVSRIITDKAVMDVTPEGLLLKEIAEAVDLDELISITEAELLISDNVLRF